MGLSPRKYINIDKNHFIGIPRFYRFFFFLFYKYCNPLTLWLRKLAWRRQIIERERITGAHVEKPPDAVKDFSSLLTGDRSPSHSAEVNEGSKSSDKKHRFVLFFAPPTTLNPFCLFFMTPGCNLPRVDSALSRLTSDPKG